MSACETTTVRELSVFILKVYITPWFTAQCAALAPLNDLKLLQNLDNYKIYNVEVSKAAVKSFKGHLWYLSEMLVTLALFDDRVSNDEKIKMIAALEKPGSNKPPRRIIVAPSDVQHKVLSNFVTNNSRQILMDLGIDLQFLRENPSTWGERGDFKSAKKSVSCLKIVNDAAERGIALATSYNAILTNQEDQKQYLLQVVEKHRASLKDCNKKTIKNLK